MSKEEMIKQIVKWLSKEDSWVVRQVYRATKCMRTPKGGVA